MIRLIDERVMEKLRDKPENIDWEEFAPGQFLGSDTARFFRIQTTEAE
ncbi:hypothetical protein N9270_03710 [Akkermansiaceae bacterium]|nr:hypothetical protein [Akkermansiaceae bacterium]